MEDTARILYSFYPAKPIDLTRRFDPHASDDLSEAVTRFELLVELFADKLITNGQMYWDHEVVCEGNRISLVCCCPADDSLDDRYLTAEARSILDEMGGTLRRRERKTLDDGQSRMQLACGADVRALCLVGFYPYSWPVRELATARAVPVYTLGLPSEDDRESLENWRVDFECVDTLWLRSSSLEAEAFDELTNIKSKLNESGLYCREDIEEASSIPTYYCM